MDSMKYKWFLFFSFFILVLISTACSSPTPSILLTETNTVVTPIPDTVTAIVNSTEQPLPLSENTPQPTPKTQDQEFILPEYNLRIRYDYSNHAAQIHEVINYTNNSSFTMPDILFAVDPLRYADSFLLESIIINQNTYQEIEIGPSWIKIDLIDPILPGASVEIEMVYILTLPSIANPLPDQKPGIFGFTILQTNFVDWYPFVPPISEDGTWLLHDAWFFGEYLVYELANFSVEITLENTPENTVIAASAAPSRIEPNTSFYEHKAARNFVWSLSPSYLVKTENVNGIEISSYYFAFNQKAGEQALIETSKAVKLYEDLFGPYPHKSLAIVEADFLDGMEYDGLYFLSKGFYNLYDGTPQGYLTMIAVHETAHQWWYTKVGNDQALEPWLDEALCTYSELIFYENYYPDLTNWWWEYRVNYYQPTGKIDLTIYEYPGFTPYRDATYLQGAKFLHQLRSKLGDETFFTFLRTYASMYSGKTSSTDLFWQLVTRINGDITPDIMNEFFTQ